MSISELSARYAALVALTDAVGAQKNKASTDLRAFLAEASMTKGTLSTPFGPVTLRENKGGTAVAVTDEDALVGWCEQNAPDALERITRVRAGDRDAIVSTRFVAVAGKVVDSLTGEVVPFAQVKVTDPSPPTPSYGASERQRDVKRLAADIAAQRAAGLVEHLQAVTLELDSAPPEYDPMEGE